MISLAPAENSAGTRYNDTAAGVTVTALRIPVEDGLIAAIMYTPQSARAGHYVVCPSLWSEAGSNHRREKLLARGLARAGHPVVQFTYRGCGDSIDGSQSVPTLESMRADATAAASVWDGSVGQATSFVGFRAGCFPAATLVAQGLGRLGLWDPPDDGAAYLASLRRASRVTALRDGQRPSPESEVVEILGHEVSSDTLASLGEATFDDLGSPRDVRVVQIDRSAGLRPPLAATVDRWRAVGHNVSATCVRQRRGWWFVPDDVHSPDIEQADGEVVASLLSWALAEPR